MPDAEDWRQDEETHHQNLLYFKSQQWHVTNYGFLLLGALHYIRSHIREVQGSEWLPILVAAAAAFIIGDLEATIWRARELAKESRKNRGLAVAKEPCGAWKLVAWSVPIFLTLALMVGAALVAFTVVSNASLWQPLLWPPIGAFVGGLIGWLARRDPKGKDDDGQTPQSNRRHEVSDGNLASDG